MPTWFSNIIVKVELFYVKILLKSKKIFTPEQFDASYAQKLLTLIDLNISVWRGCFTNDTSAVSCVCVSVNLFCIRGVRAGRERPPNELFFVFPTFLLVTVNLSRHFFLSLNLFSLTDKSSLSGSSKTLHSPVLRCSSLDLNPSQSSVTPRLFVSVFAGVGNRVFTRSVRSLTCIFDCFALHLTCSVVLRFFCAGFLFCWIMKANRFPRLLGLKYLQTWDPLVGPTLYNYTDLCCLPVPTNSLCRLCFTTDGK